MRALLLAVMFVAGCTVGPKYEKPAAELPESWKESAPRFAEDGRWWRVYADGELDKVVDEALAGNGDLLIAAARVDEARALLGEASSFFFPSVEARYGTNRQQISTRTATAFPAPKSPSN